MSTVYLNGRFLPLEQAQVSVMDRGFLFGDSVYEMIPVFGRHCFRLAEHLDRLDYSLRETRIPQPLSREQWRHVFEKLIELHDTDDMGIYLQITRGAYEVREHSFPAQCLPTVFAMSRALRAAPEPPAPLSCITLQDIRWHRCDIKTTSLLGNVLMTQQALENGADEAILLRDGCVWEGASSNVFVAIGDVLYTAPKGSRILGGITRDLVVELAVQHGLQCREQAVSAEALARADEIWLSSSTRELAPVAKLDGKPVGGGSTGPLFSTVWGWYRNFRQQFTR